MRIDPLGNGVFIRDVDDDMAVLMAPFFKDQEIPRIIEVSQYVPPSDPLPLSSDMGDLDLSLPDGAMENARKMIQTALPNCAWEHSYAHSVNGERGMYHRMMVKINSAALEGAEGEPSNLFLSRYFEVENHFPGPYYEAVFNGARMTEDQAKELYESIEAGLGAINEKQKEEKRETLNDLKSRVSEEGWQVEGKEAFKLETADGVFIVRQRRESDPVPGTDPVAVLKYLRSGGEPFWGLYSGFLSNEFSVYRSDSEVAELYADLTNRLAPQSITTAGPAHARAPRKERQAAHSNTLEDNLATIDACQWQRTEKKETEIAASQQTVLGALFGFAPAQHTGSIVEEGFKVRLKSLHPDDKGEMQVDMAGQIWLELRRTTVTYANAKHTKSVTFSLLQNSNDDGNCTIQIASARHARRNRKPLQTLFEMIEQTVPGEPN